jgi:hypothetical protein
MNGKNFEQNSNDLLISANLQLTDSGGSGIPAAIVMSLLEMLSSIKPGSLYSPKTDTIIRCE